MQKSLQFVFVQVSPLEETITWLVTRVQHNALLWVLSALEGPGPILQKGVRIHVPNGCINMMERFLKRKECRKREKRYYWLAQQQEKRLLELLVTSGNRGTQVTRTNQGEIPCMVTKLNCNIMLSFIKFARNKRLREVSHQKLYEVYCPREAGYSKRYQRVSSY